MKKLIALILSVLMILAQLTTLASAQAETEVKELSGTFTYWTWADQLKFQAEEFEKIHPNVKINIEIFGGDEYENKIRSVLAAGSGAPDMFDLEEGYVGKYIDSDRIANLDEMGAAELKEAIFPYLVAMGTDSNGVFKGVGNNISPVAYWYNRAAAKQWLGTDDAMEISGMLSSWDKIFEAAQKVKEASNGEVWLWPNLDEIPKLIAPSMPSFVDGNGRFVLDAKWWEATAVMRKFWNDELQGNLNSWSGEWAAAWNEGKLILRVMPSWDFFASDETKAAGNMGVAKPHLGAYEGARLQMISADSKNKELAYEFIKFSLSADFQKANLEKNNQVPCNMALLEELKEGFSAPAFGGQNTLETYIAIAENIPLNHYDKYSRELINKFNKTARNGVKEGWTDEQIEEEFRNVVRDTFPELEP